MLPELLIMLARSLAWFCLNEGKYKHTACLLVRGCLLKCEMHGGREGTGAQEKEMAIETQRDK